MKDKKKVCRAHAKHCSPQDERGKCRLPRGHDGLHKAMGFARVVNRRKMICEPIGPDYKWSGDERDLLMAWSSKPLLVRNVPPRRRTRVPARVLIANPGQVVILYRNRRGKVSEREIRPERIWFGKREGSLEREWLLKAWDLVQGVDREFAMRDIVQWKVMR